MDQMGTTAMQRDIGRVGKRKRSGLGRCEKGVERTFLEQPSRVWNVETQGHRSVQWRPEGVTASSPVTASRDCSEERLPESQWRCCPKLLRQRFEVARWPPPMLAGRCSDVAIVWGNGERSSWLDTKPELTECGDRRYSKPAFGSRLGAVRRSSKRGGRTPLGRGLGPTLALPPSPPLLC